MAKSSQEFKKDCIKLVNIYITTVDKQISLNTNKDMVVYLEAYREACKGILKDIENISTE